MKVILFAGAEIRDYSFCEGYMDGVDTVICCDAGMRHARKLGIVPDYIVGDFDSASAEVLVIDQHLTLHGKVGDLVSTLPLSMEVTGITLKGFSYPLTDATLTLDGDYIAVSNVLAEETATIDIKSGYLYVICSRD